MSISFPRPIILTVCLFLLFVFAQLALAADHREAPAISFEYTGESDSCTVPLHHPIHVNVQVPSAVLSQNRISVNMITRAATGDVDGSDYATWQRLHGPVFSTVVNADALQSTEIFLAFPAAPDQDYEAKFRFESVVDRESCVLVGKVPAAPDPVQIVKIQIGGAN
jgi:hypothetical protein